MSFDAVVVGLGGVGSFALRALARQGKGGRFLGVEQFQAGGHQRGSSHGRTRIYRRAYFEHPSYVPWIQHSIKVFEEIEQSQNLSLLAQCGCLLLAPSGSLSPTLSRMPPLLASSYSSALQHDIPVEFLTTSDLKERYPQLLYRHEMVGLLEPHAGLLRPERAIRAALNEARAEPSVTIMDQTRVVNIEATSEPGHRFVLRLRHGTTRELEEITTRSVLVSAGAYVTTLVPSWSSALSVTRQFQCWIDMSTSPHRSRYSSDALPAWYMETPDWPIPVYGIPTDAQADDTFARHWLKVSSHGRDSVVRNPLLSPDRLSAAEMDECRAVAAAGVDLTPWGGASHSTSSDSFFAEAVPCLYTMTPDKNYLIGSPIPGVFCVAGLSGHGFKMTPALGQMMADYALGFDLKGWHLDFCSPSRFGLIEKTF